MNMIHFVLLGTYALALQKLLSRHGKKIVMCAYFSVEYLDDFFNTDAIVFIFC